MTIPTTTLTPHWAMTAIERLDTVDELNVTLVRMGLEPLAAWQTDLMDDKTLYGMRAIYRAAAEVGEVAA